MGTRPIAIPDNEVQYNIPDEEVQISKAAEPKQPQKEGFLESLGAGLPGYNKDDAFAVLKDAKTGFYHMFTHPADSANLLYHGVVDPMQLTNEKAVARMKQEGVLNKVTGAIQYAESGIPFMGPALSKAGEQAESGNIPGALGTTAAVALPGLIPGGMEAARAGISKATTMPETAARLYQSALKPSTILSQAQRANIIKTGLTNEIPVSPAGVEKLGSLLDDLQQKVSAEIQTNPQAPISKYAVASRLTPTAQRFATQVAPESDLEAIAQTGNEFLRNQPANISAEQAQALKVGTYQQLKSRSYGELKSATVESQKALARGLKEEIGNIFPEVNKLNAQESQLFGLDKQLERAVGRIDNHQLLGIGTPLAAAGAKAMTGSTGLATATGILKAVFDDPALKSKLAIVLNRKGVPLAQANARVAAYAAALGNAASGLTRENPTNEQGVGP